MAEEEWISAYGALMLVAGATSVSTAIRAICTRAHDGLIVTKAMLYIEHKTEHDDAFLPKSFWWACGESALTQNWQTGDFETWIESTRHLRAYGVSFAKSGLMVMIGPALAARASSAISPTVVPSPQAVSGGRPAAAWWDDLWIEMCRQLYVGDLKPTKQADIETAMMTWAATQGYDPAESTIRARARKLWIALKSEGEN